MASEVSITVSKEERERARLESEFKYELDTQSRITYARQEGWQEGEREGRQEGIREGERKGWQERNMEILNLIKAGCSLEEIEARLKAGGGR
jgi:flagellar biosynthesis/type III secretory pathway protein FliH